MANIIPSAASDNEGSVAWTQVSGTSATVDAATGLVTAHATTTGDTVIKAEESGTLNDGSITITVVK